MKRIKIMLLTMTVLAAAGGVLAFKTKKQQLYCTAPVPISGNCQNVQCNAGSPIDATTTTSGSAICVKAINVANCNTQLCDVLARTTTE